MSAGARSAAGWMGVVAALLAVGVALDLFWVRPQEGRLRSLREEKAKLVSLQVQAGLSNAGIADSAERSVASAAAFEDPLRFLGDAARRARLEQRRLQVLTQRSDAAGGETAYEMEVFGSFRGLVEFLRTVELARPVVVITGIHLMAPLLGTDVTLRFQAAVPGPTAAG